MAQAIQVVEHGVFDVMILTETKIQSEAYSHNRLGYDVNYLVVRPSISGVYQGGVDLVTRERPIEWGIDSTRYHRPNMVSFEIVTGLTWTPLVGAYLPPSMLKQLPGLEEALQSFRDPILLRYLNVDIKEARIP